MTIAADVITRNEVAPLNSAVCVQKVQMRMSWFVIRIFLQYCSFLNLALAKSYIHAVPEILILGTLCSGVCVPMYIDLYFHSLKLVPPPPKHVKHVTFPSPVVSFTIILVSAEYSPLSAPFSQTAIPGLLRTCKPVRKYRIIDLTYVHIATAGCIIKPISYINDSTM